MYLLEPPHRGGSNLYRQAMFKAKILKLPFISTMNLSNFAAEKIFSCLLFIYLFIYLFIHAIFSEGDALCISHGQFFRNITAPDIECRDPGSGSGLLTYHKKTSRSC